MHIFLHIVWIRGIHVFLTDEGPIILQIVDFFKAFLDFIKKFDDYLQLAIYHHLLTPSYLWLKSRLKYIVA